MEYQSKFRETLNRKAEFGSEEGGGDLVSRLTSYVEVAVFCKPYNNYTYPAPAYVHHPALAWLGN